MNNKDLRKLARNLQAERKKEIRSACDQLLKRIHYDYSNIKNKNIIFLHNELYKSTSVSLKVKNINLDFINDTLGIYNTSEYCRKLLLILINKRIPTIESIFQDLKYIKREFDNITYDHGELIVKSHPVELNEIEFGSFNMYFNNKFPLNNEVDVRLIAITPNIIDDYVHPHICDEGLCLGEGNSAIANSLRDFRILDYFCIINNIINTYGSDPYISLESWNGIKCNNCFDTVSNSFACIVCSEIYCYDCIGSCCENHDDYCELCVNNCKKGCSE